MFRVAAFIDAGYLWKQVCKVIVPDEKNYLRKNVKISYSNFRKTLTKYIKDTFPDIPLLRCYWYDGALTEGKSSADHSTVAQMNDFKLRLGGGIRESQDGKMRQKGVDGLIIADLISLAQKKALSHALLISGDGDMVPGVEVAQTLGLRIHLLAIHSERATSPFLRKEVDFFEIWHEDIIHQFAQPSTFTDTPNSKESSSSEHNLQTKTSFSSESVISDEKTAPALEKKLNSPEVELFNNLTEEEKASITSSFIPSDIDKRLLRLGYEINNIRLTEDEKRNLRAKLKELALPKPEELV